MTSPGGHGGNDINLAALWIPVMPETSHMGEEMRKAGAESKRKFEEGFNSGNSPESMGETFGARLQSGMSAGMKGFELPFGLSNMVEKFSGEVDTKLIQKLRGEASSALAQYRTEYEKLTEAQGRAAEAERNIKLARDNNINSAQVILPLMTEQIRGTKDAEAAHKSASAAYETYNAKAVQLNAVTKEAAGTSATFAGAMGGAVVAGVQMAMGAIESFYETLVEGVVEGFKMSIEGAKEFADTMIEVGESYEHIGIQIQEFSTASGEQLEEMETVGRRVFNSLDVAGQDTGKTMAQFASMLGAPAEAVESLTKHFEELQGRYTDMRANDLAQIFVAFKTPAEEADSALASLLQSARNSGQDLGQLTQALSGTAAVTLQEAGLNIQQAGAFMGDLLKLGEPGRQVMGGLATAMKDFGKEGLSFSDGMKEAGQQLKALGDTAAGADLAEKLFGTRNWIIAKNAALDYINVLDQGPNAFNQNASSIDDFIVHTENLQNQWELVKHKAEEAFYPMGMEALKLAGTGLEWLSKYVSDHMNTIKSYIILGGLEIIKYAGELQKFGEGLLLFFAPIANGIAELMNGAIQTLSGFSLAAGEVLSWIPGMKDIGNGLISASHAASNMGEALSSLKVGDKMTDLAKWSQQHHIDVDAASHSWVNFAETVGTSMDDANAAVNDKSRGWFGSSGEGASAPNWFGGNGTPGGPGDPGWGGPGGVEQGPGDAGYRGPTSHRDDPNYTGAPAPSGGGMHRADWNAIAQNESSGNWTNADTGHNGHYGGLQISQSTWDQFGGKEFADRPDHASRIDQIQVGERILNGWKGGPGQGPNAWDNGKTYVEKKAKGGAPGRSITSGSGNGDDVAALLSRGEYVWDTATVDKYGWLIKALHQGPSGFDTGGDVNSYGRNTLDQAILAGVPSGHYADPGEKRDDLSKGLADCSSAIEALVNHLQGGGLTAPSGMYTGNEAAWLLSRGFVPGEGGPGDFRVGFNSHHTQATLPGGTPFNWGSESAAQNRGVGGTGADDPAFTSHYYLPFRQGADGAQYPGMPGQYGGGGVYGGETYDQMVNAQQAVQSAQDRAADLDHQVQQNQKRIDDIKAQIAAVGSDPGKVGALGHPQVRTPAEIAADDKKRKDLNDQLDEATYQLSRSQRDRSEQDGKITEAQRKEQEAQYKKPSGTSSSSRQSTEGKAGETLGQGLLAGIGQELGIGDVLGKSPLDWGVVKLATGLFNYANSLGDAVFGATGGTAGGGMVAGNAGVLPGVVGSLGITLPRPSVSAGPNIQPGSVPIASGQGTGPLPGPVVQGDFMPINVQAGVDPKAVLAPVQEQRNAQNANTFQHSGGFPAS